MQGSAFFFRNYSKLQGRQMRSLTQDMRKLAVICRNVPKKRN